MLHILRNAELSFLAMLKYVCTCGRTFVHAHVTINERKYVKLYTRSTLALNAKLSA